MRNRICLSLVLMIMAAPAQAATTIPLTVNLSETVTVTGTPRITVDVGGTTRYAAYSSGSGTNVLTFTLSPQAGDVDLDGITVSSPIDLNGGSIKDTAGNDATLIFTPPNTAGIKINYPSLSMDFVTDADGRYTLNGTAYNDLTSFLSASGGTFSRASVGTYYDSAGTLQTASSGTPRFDWDPVTHTAKGILIEESRTNLISYSHQVDNAAWTKQLVSISPDVLVAPDGSSSADKLVETAAAGTHRVTRNITVSSGQSYTISFYAKAEERTRLFVLHNNEPNGFSTFNLSTATSVNGSAASSTITPIGNSWYRCTVTSIMTGTSRGLEIWLVDASDATSYTGDGTSGLYIWGIQLEQGAFPTSYIPTTSAAVTRSADILSVPTAGAWFNASSGAVFSESSFSNFTSTTAMDATYALWGSGNTRMVTGRRIGGSASASELAFYVQDSGVDQAWLRSSSAVLSSSPVKFSSAYAANSFAHQTSSLSLATDTLGSVPLVTSLFIGSQNGISSFLNGNIRSLKYYPARVTNTQLQLLTQ